MNLNEQINHLYDQYAQDIREFNINIMREDGTNVFSNRKEKQNPPLIAAAWKAISTINIADSHDERDQFRLSFEVSNKGIHVLCFEFMKKKYYSSIIYENTLNPALIKKQFRDFVENVSGNLKQIHTSQFTAKKIENDFLFQDFSDAELDSVFSQLRGNHVVC